MLEGWYIYVQVYLGLEFFDYMFGESCKKHFIDKIKSSFSVVY